MLYFLLFALVDSKQIIKNINVPSCRNCIYYQPSFFSTDFDSSTSKCEKIGEKNITIIDDSYNASLLSMRSGLEYAANLKNALGKKRVIAALGDMRELGEKSDELHEKVVKYLEEFHIDFAVLVGESMKKASQKLPTKLYKTFFDSTVASLEIEGFLNDGDILYLKGSRGTKMEKLIENLTGNKSAH
jgi:UDP-N-acetylmuramoyl-tripeptide--D-alanyl-D-alanine ligase